MLKDGIVVKYVIFVFVRRSASVRGDSRVAEDPGETVVFPAGRRLPADGAAAVPGCHGAPGPARPLRGLLQHHQRGGLGTQPYWFSSS